MYRVVVVGDIAIYIALILTCSAWVAETVGRVAVIFSESGECLVPNRERMLPLSSCYSPPYRRRERMAIETKTRLVFAAERTSAKE